MNNLMEEMTLEERQKRHEKADEILTALEKEHDFKLSQPWKEDALPHLLLRGLSDASLYKIFNTLMRVEYEAGRLETRPNDLSWMSENK